MFLDGGTVMFEIADRSGRRLVGGFDGRMCEVDSDMNRCGRWHMFLDADHPTRAGARLLPLWGKEERALIQLLRSILDEQLSRPDQEHVARITGKNELPDSVSIEHWHLVRDVVGRERLLEAIDRGLPACDDCMGSHLGNEQPFAVGSITRNDSTDCYEVMLRDHRGGGFVLALPADTTSTRLPSSMFWSTNYAYASDEGPTKWFPHTVLRSAIGASGDRCLLTTIMLVLPSTPADTPGATLKDAVAATTRWRIRKTFEADAKN
jgi:hypothetical protein